VMWATKLPRLHQEDLHGVAGVVGHVEMLAVHDDAAHRAVWVTMLVEHDVEAERRWHIEWCVVPVDGKAPLAGGD